jgi:hypothetical protein
MFGHNHSIQLCKSIDTVETLLYSLSNMTKPINVSTDLKITIKGTEFTLSKSEASQLLDSLCRELNVLDYNPQSVPSTISSKDNTVWTTQINTDNPICINGVHTSTYTFCN